MKQRSNMRKDDRVRLCHMFDAAREAIFFVHNRERVDLESFLLSGQHINATIVFPYQLLALSLMVP